MKSLVDRIICHITDTVLQRHEDWRTAYCLKQQPMEQPKSTITCDPCGGDGILPNRSIVDGVL